jgi:hypothetical protein
MAVVHVSASLMGRIEEFYSPSQKRDRSGRFTTGGGLSPGFSQGREWVPLKEFGLRYRKGNERIPVVADAKRLANESPERWQSMPKRRVRIQDLNPIEESVKSKYIERILSGEPLRKGYDPFVLIDKDGSQYLIDGHHRAAMYAALGRSSMPAHVIDLRRDPNALGG